MKELNIVQFGFGNIGKKLIELSHLKDLKYVAICDSKGGLFNSNGIDINNLLNINRLSELDNYQEGLNSHNLVEKLNGFNNYVIVDVTASKSLSKTVIMASEIGYNVVLANKKPLTGTLSDFKKLKNQKFECTVGAGLPIINILKSLISTGDNILEINGCFSGTLGYIFSELEKGDPLSKIVKKAKQLGYTEPDPRDDLSGMDVARKALILARLCGYKLELKDVLIESLVPPKLIDCSIEIFLEGLSNYDHEFEKKYKLAAKNNRTLRYVASIKEGKLAVGLKDVDKDSQIGSLRGPSNICVIKSEKYKESPLVIQGPGAGIDVTADGVLRNILEFEK